MNELALFAGAGGGILGGKLLGWRTICAVEWEPYPASVLCARQNDGVLEAFPIWDDVQTFDGHPWRGIVDVVSGGFPCQDISAAGKGAGIDGERSGMWGEMARIIHEVRPKYVFVENSPMLTSRGLGRVLGDLAGLGFDARWGVLGAADVGAKHQRDRIWIVARWKGNLPHAQHDRIRRWEQQQKSVAQTPNGSNPNLLHDAMRGDCENHEEGLGEWGVHTRGGVSDSWQRCEEVPRQGSCDGQVSNTASNGLQGQANERILEGKGSDELQPSQPRDTSEMANPQMLGQSPCDITPHHRPGRDVEGQSWGSSHEYARANYWQTEPNVGRVVNGLASRVDRLKAIGNGQVPLCAATAWRILSDT